MASDPLTTIPVHASTRDELNRLKTGGQSYDEVIRTILKELEERDPWYQDMVRRIREVQSGKVKLVPFEGFAEMKRSEGKGRRV